MCVHVYFSFFKFFLIQDYFQCKPRVWGLITYSLLLLLTTKRCGSTTAMSCGQKSGSDTTRMDESGGVGHRGRRNVQGRGPTPETPSGDNSLARRLLEDLHRMIFHLARFTSTLMGQHHSVEGVGVRAAESGLATTQISTSALSPRVDKQTTEPNW